MKLKILVLGISLLMFSSCDKDVTTANPQNNPESNSINKIMPLGASRVAGDRPEYESFRYELWKDLREQDWTFDYIGTQSDEAYYPMFNNLDFDTDHEGRAGWTSGEILNDIDNWLAETGAPDIVLFSTPGGNDALQNLPYDQTVSNIIEIVDILQNANPEVTIIIEQLAPARSDLMTTELTNYFNQLIEDVLTIATENSTASSQVIAVDMFTGFTDSLLADDVHYNEAGAEFIASRYYMILENILEE
jgi:lysophospholipase L1-like esterase